MQEKEMEIGFAGFLFLLGKMASVREKRKKKRKKHENGKVLTGQAGMKVIG